MIEMWSIEKIEDFRRTLLAWYDEEGRASLPWRKNQDPYRIWVSEIMLQQTQVNTVIPYFKRFMTLFPTITDLAGAEEQTLLKAWEGLGYYSRVRNMQKAAQQVVEDYQGVWPTTFEGLKKLTGIGPYTAAAIASIAFKEPVAAIDGNAYRVLGRMFKIEDDIRQTKTWQKYFAIGNQLIDPKRPGDFNQAIMDLGSSYMTAKNYDTAHNPIKEFIASYEDGTEDLYPVKSPLAKPKPVSYVVIAVVGPDGYLWEQRPATGLLANFWLMPLYAITDFESDPDAEWTMAEIIQATETRLLADYGVTVSLKALGGRPVTHVYSHLKWTVTILTGEITETMPLKRGVWRQRDVLNDDPQPKVQEKIWQRLNSLQG